MKKILMIAALAALGASCSKDMEDLSVATAEVNKLESFTLSIDGTRMSMSDGENGNKKMEWDAGDAVSVIGNVHDNCPVKYTATSAGTTTTFTYADTDPIEEGSTVAAVVYPYESCYVSDNAILYPANVLSQNGTGLDKCYMASYSPINLDDVATASPVMVHVGAVIDITFPYGPSNTSYVPSGYDIIGFKLLNTYTKGFFDYTTEGGCESLKNFDSGDITVAFDAAKSSSEAVSAKVNVLPYTTDAAGVAVSPLFIKSNEPTKDFVLYSCEASNFVKSDAGGKEIKRATYNTLTLTAAMTSTSASQEAVEFNSVTITGGTQFLVNGVMESTSLATGLVVTFDHDAIWSDETGIDAFDANPDKVSAPAVKVTLALPFGYVFDNYSSIFKNGKASFTGEINGRLQFKLAGDANNTTQMNITTVKNKKMTDLNTSGYYESTLAIPIKNAAGEERSFNVTVKIPVQTTVD